MSAIMDPEKATDRALLQIARGFCRQTFPLKDEGSSLKEDVERVLQLNDLSWLRSNVALLPTVENPRPEIFRDFELDHDDAHLIFGRKLIVVQTHLGCTWQCEGFCDADAPPCIVQKMPYMGVYKISEEKIGWDKRFLKVARNWFEMLHGSWKSNFAADTVGGRDIYGDEKNLFVLSPSLLSTVKSETDLSEAVETMDEDAFIRFFVQHYNLRLDHPINDYLRMYPLSDVLSLGDIRNMYHKMIPVFSNPIRSQILPFNANCPLEYWDENFLHENGDPANYGDYFHRMTSAFRPVFTSSPGWLPSNKHAERSVETILKLHQTDDWLTAGFRLTIKRYNWLARKDPARYLENLKRVVDILWPLGESLFLEFYEDTRIEGDRLWAEGIHDELKKHCLAKWGNWVEEIEFQLVSRKKGKAYDPAGEDDFDPGGDAWGIHIYPDGKVYYQVEAQWKRWDYDDNSYNIMLQSPDSSHQYVGLKLW